MKGGRDMMMSSNGNIFHVTGPLWGESTSHWWIPLTKASDMELLFWSVPKQTVVQTIDTLVIWDAITLIMTSLTWMDRQHGHTMLNMTVFLDPNGQRAIKSLNFTDHFDTKSVQQNIMHINQIQDDIKQVFITIKFANANQPENWEFPNYFKMESGQQNIVTIRQVQDDIKKIFITANSTNVNPVHNLEFPNYLKIKSLIQQNIVYIRGL